MSNPMASEHRLQLLELDASLAENDEVRARERDDRRRSPCTGPTVEHGQFDTKGDPDVFGMLARCLTMAIRARHGERANDGRQLAHEFVIGTTHPDRGWVTAEMK